MPHWSIFSAVDMRCDLVVLRSSMLFGDFRDHIENPMLLLSTAEGRRALLEGTADESDEEDDEIEAAEAEAHSSDVDVPDTEDLVSQFVTIPQGILTSSDIYSSETASDCGHGGVIETV